MVSCRLVGRMANQMFTIAATISYALRHGLEYHIPAHTLNDNVWKPIFTHLQNPNWKPTPFDLIAYERTHSYEPIGEFHHYTETSENIGFNIIIDGYRQSLKYFEDYLPEVRKAFGFYYNPQSKNACAIHVRRGDYLNYPTKHPVVSKQYVLDAMKIMKDKGATNFNFFSDDIEWCKNEFEHIPDMNGCFINFHNDNPELIDFQLMLCCNHFIISNSTFSLMAAILSESPNKIVISPDESNWFGSGNSHLDVSDLIPKEYIRIKY